MADKKNKANADFYTVEAYKLARTNISLSIIKQGCKKILFTSALSGEGKTTTSCNVAAAFSKKLNTKVLVIDCDLRKPTVAKFFGIKNVPGVTNYLGGMVEIDDIIQNVPNTELYVIPSGIIPPNPSELLASEEFKKLVSELEKRFDYIIFDSTPINVVSDCLHLTELVDGVVLVAYENVSNYAELDKAVETFKRCDTKILGFILTGSKNKEKINRKEIKYR